MTPHDHMLLLFKLELSEDTVTFQRISRSRTLDWLRSSFNNIKSGQLFSNPTAYIAILYRVTYIAMLYRVTYIAILYRVS